MKRHQFEQHARHFRSGTISLNQLIDMVYGSGKEIAVIPPSEAPVAVQVAGESYPFPKLKRRPTDAHKGDFGSILLVGGCRGMAGAISLAAMAAMRSGSGRVTVAVPESIADVVAGFDPCYMTLPCPDSSGHFSIGVRNEISETMENNDVVAIGPGMGREVDRLVLEALLETDKPLVIDADGLFLIGKHSMRIEDRKAPTILTPHEGEFSALVGGTFTSRTETEAAAIEFAKNKSVTMVLKGHGTLVTDGTQTYRNQTGNPGMATGGSGDVLTGVIASLLGQGYGPMDAAVLGVCLHGKAGDLAAESLGVASMVATDILDALADAFKPDEFKGSPTTPLGEFRIGF